jgi:hypothetical protein
MQQFKAKLKDTPRDAPQVSCSVSISLNKEEILSEMSKVLTLNNLEVDLHQHKGEQNLRVSAIVCVLNMRGEPLDPCSARKARKLIKEGKAKVVKGTLFYIIQLTYATGQQKHKCSIGVGSDTLFSHTI